MLKVFGNKRGVPEGFEEETRRLYDEVTRGHLVEYCNVQYKTCSGQGLLLQSVSLYCNVDNVPFGACEKDVNNHEALRRLFNKLRASLPVVPALPE
jgi:hypothetical protein